MHVHAARVLSHRQVCEKVSDQAQQEERIFLLHMPLVRLRQKQRQSQKKQKCMNINTQTNSNSRLHCFATETHTRRQRDLFARAALVILALAGVLVVKIHHTRTRTCSRAHPTHPCRRQSGLPAAGPTAGPAAGSFRRTRSAVRSGKQGIARQLTQFKGSDTAHAPSAG